MPDEVAQLGPKDLGQAALRILKRAGADEYDERAFRAAIKQVIREALNPKRKV